MTWVGAGGLASSLPVALAACSQTNKTESSPNIEFQPVGSVEELDKSSQLLNKESPIGSVLVVRTAATNELSAVNPTCPHAGCVVQWQKSQEKFVCPCHGAEFSVDGKVLKGPAKKTLKAYQAKIEGNSVLVKQS
jgi:cytochrome b6-f complex iron-sulfur subunit